MQANEHTQKSFLRTLLLVLKWAHLGHITSKPLDTDKQRRQIKGTLNTMHNSDEINSENHISMWVKHSSHINGRDPASPPVKHFLQCGHLVTELKFWSMEMINPPTIGGGERNLFSLKQELNWFLIWLLLLQMGSKTFEKGCFIFFFKRKLLIVFWKSFAACPYGFFSWCHYHYRTTADIMFIVISRVQMSLLMQEKNEIIFKNDKSWRSAGSLGEGKTENEKMKVDQWASVRRIFGRNL